MRKIAVIPVLALLAAGCSQATDGAPLIAPTETIVSPDSLTPAVEIPVLEAPDLGKIRGTTFGDSPECALLAGEEVAAAFDQEVSDIYYEAGLGCEYDDEYGFALLAVGFDTGAGLKCTNGDGTYLGSPVEEIVGLGERATWSETAGSLCVLQGEARFQISPASFSPFYADDKSLAIDLALVAIDRLP